MLSLSKHEGRLAPISQDVQQQPPPACTGGQATSP